MSNKEIFTQIYTNRIWGGTNDSPLSGPGSAVWYTENLRSQLPKILQSFGVKTLLDAGCGDLTWISTIFEDLNINYIGVDVVEFLITEHQKNYPNHHFEVLDITVDDLPRADMMMCRDCMFHMSFEDIYRTLNNFVKSEIPLLFATSHATPAMNVNITTGGYAELDFFKKPFCFPKPVFALDDTHPAFVKRNMCVWTREQVAEAIKT